MALVHKTLWESVRELVLEQYRRSPNLLGLIRAVVGNAPSRLRTTPPRSRTF